MEDVCILFSSYVPGGGGSPVRFFFVLFCVCVCFLFYFVFSSLCVHLYFLITMEVYSACMRARNLRV